MTAHGQHWRDLYRSRAEAQTSWYRPHLDESLRLITEFAGDRAAPVLDVGGGRSTLVDDLLAQNYCDISVLDVSADALAQSRDRIAAARGADIAASVHWIESDILGADLPMARFGLWHDRAVFHFLVDDSEQDAYVALVERSLRPGGIAIVATFANDGPDACSGLPVQRYDAAALAARFGAGLAGAGFERLADARELHATPTGTTQAFTYVVLRRLPSPTQLRAAHAPG